MAKCECKDARPARNGRSEGFWTLYRQPCADKVFAVTVMFAVDILGYICPIKDHLNMPCCLFVWLPHYLNSVQCAYIKGIPSETASCHCTAVRDISLRDRVFPIGER